MVPRMKQTKYLARSAETLLDDFGAGNAAPGSGSAAALMGLLSEKLIITICKKSLEYSKSESDQRIFEYLIEHVQDLMIPRLKELFEKDAVDFEKVVDLRKKRKRAKSPNRKAALSREANDLLEVTTDYVFDVIELCMSLVEHSIVIFEDGWSAVRGDSGASISAAIAGVMTGIFVVNLNLKTLKGRKYAKVNISRCDDIYSRLQEKQIKAFSCVVSLNSEALDAIQLELEGTEINEEIKGGGRVEK